MISRFLLKMKAKQAIFTTKPSPILAGLMLTGVYFLIYIFQYTGSADAYNELLQNGSYTVTQLMEAMYKDIVGNKTALILQLVFSLLNSYISFGMMCYSLKLASSFDSQPIGSNEIPSERERISVQEMFPPLLTFIKSFAITLLTSLLTAIGIVFFIVPGIILAVCYSQARFIMLEHPEMSIIKCMTASRKLMRNRIGEYFLLSLSFIGWQLMTSISVITGIWTYPYINITMAFYYKDISAVEAA